MGGGVIKIVLMGWLWTLPIGSGNRTTGGRLGKGGEVTGRRWGYVIYSGYYSEKKEKLKYCRTSKWMLFFI